MCQVFYTKNILFIFISPIIDKNYLLLKVLPQLLQCQLFFPFLPTSPSRTSGQEIKNPIQPTQPLKFFLS